MKKLLVTLLISYSSASYSFNDDAYKNFDTSKNTVESMTVIWKAVDDVQTVCEAESRKRGSRGFGYAVNACSFWEGNVCTVVTKRQVNMHTLGHEVRHCFQGNWH
jgi:hypothetical protein